MAKKSFEEVQARMSTQTAAMTTVGLCDTLLLLEGRELDEPERMVQAHISDEICKRSPEANAAADRWVEDTEMWVYTLTKVIVAAALAAVEDA